MYPDAKLHATASLIADRNRAQLLLALMGGAPLAGSALAEAAGISRSLASAHLTKLVAGGLVQAEASGRQRLYTIASPEVAEALEGLVHISPPAEVRSLRQATRSKSLRWARMCYDHLAGIVGVTVTDALLDHGFIGEQDGAFRLGPGGADGFGGFGIDVAGLQARRRPLLRPCLDWSERRHHLAGSLGAAIAAELTRRQWLRGQEASRIVTVTPAGQQGLRDWLGIDLTELRAAA
jgi:DNA-binding transcriptional ArsR family regulator